MGEALPTLKDWEELALKELKGREVSELDWHTAEGIRLKPLYTAADLEELEMATRAGFCLGGPKATMYAGRPWTIRRMQASRRLKNQMPFTVRIWHWTKRTERSATGKHRGYDSDHPRVVGDVGKAGWRSTLSRI